MNRYLYPTFIRPASKTFLGDDHVYFNMLNVFGKGLGPSLDEAMEKSKIELQKRMILAGGNYMEIEVLPDQSMPRIYCRAKFYYSHE